jgi:recombination protein RecT
MTSAAARAGTTAIQPAGKPATNAPKTLEQMLVALQPAIMEALPKHVPADRMMRIAITALRTNPKLRECTPASFLGCVVQASQLGLEVNTPLGQAYLIPFNNRRQNTVDCQLVIGYQGFMDLARRSGSVRNIYAFPVYNGDDFSYEIGLNPSIKHKPKAGVVHSKENLTHVYAVAKLDNGEPVFTVLTRDEIESYRGRSRAKNDGPWVTDYEAMCLKTGIRRLFRWLPKSAEMSRAETVDQSLELHKNQLGAVDPEVLGLLETNNIDTSEASIEPEGEPPPAPTAPAQDGQKVKLRGNVSDDVKPPQAAQSSDSQQSQPATREPGED